uniref:Uncharacterized protein n=1 Tax=Arundo donax TaxID=35708 RepID=A0A0A9D9Y6_ARUDO
MPVHNLLWRECAKSSSDVSARLAVIPLVQVPYQHSLFLCDGCPMCILYGSVSRPGDLDYVLIYVEDQRSKTKSMLKIRSKIRDQRQITGRLMKIQQSQKLT